VSAIVRVLGRLRRVDDDAPLLPGDLRRDVHEGVYGRQRLRPPDLLQVARKAAALGAADVQRASEVHRDADRHHLQRLPDADRLVRRLRRVQRLHGAGQLLWIPLLFELRLLPDDLLRKPDLRVLQGVHGGHRELHGHALLRELHVVPLVLLRKHELSGVLPGMFVQQRKLHRQLSLRQLRRVRRGLRNVQQHRMQRLHPGDDQLHWYVA
jgi:hypothetical protein